MPPLDVLLVWHAFMLNPRAYRHFETVVLCGRLGGKGIDWEDLVSDIRLYICFLSPSLP